MIKDNAVGAHYKFATLVGASISILTPALGVMFGKTARGEYVRLVKVTIFNLPKQCLNVLVSIFKCLGGSMGQ